MFAVGALDAYFCDAYTDVVAATIISKSRHPALVLPGFFYDIKFPVRAILESYANNQNWAWRMAARKMMERENVLELQTIRDLFNRFFGVGQKFFRDLIQSWITHASASRWLFGISAARFAALSGQARSDAIADAHDRLEERFRDIFQRRHDCIHNCDRPRVSPQPLRSAAIVAKVIGDIDFVLNRCDEHINVEFRQFLLGCQCPSAVIAQAGY
jgi:hypothetical protein